MEKILSLYHINPNLQLIFLTIWTIKIENFVTIRSIQPIDNIITGVATTEENMTVEIIVTLTQNTKIIMVNIFTDLTTDVDVAMLNFMTFPTEMNLPFRNICNEISHMTHTIQILDIILTETIINNFVLTMAFKAEITAWLFHKFQAAL